MRPPSSFSHEAVNTIKASNWTLFLASVFGRKEIVYDTVLQERVKLAHWRGKAYMLGRANDRASPTKEKP